MVPVFNVGPINTVGTFPKPICARATRCQAPLYISQDPPLGYYE